MGGNLCCSDGNRNNQSITVYIFYSKNISFDFIVKL